MHRLMDRDFLSAALLLVIGVVAYSQTGDDSPRDWVLPFLAIYALLAIAAALFVNFLFNSFVRNAPDIVRPIREDLPVYTDVAVFSVIVGCWVLLMYGLGFWLASFFMLSAASFYLTQDKTRKNLTVNMIVSLGATVAAFVVFLHVFYVPVPAATWWAGFR